MTWRGMNLYQMYDAMRKEDDEALIMQSRGWAALAEAYLGRYSELTEFETRIKEVWTSSGADVFLEQLGKVKQSLWDAYETAYDNARTLRAMANQIGAAQAVLEDLIIKFETEIYQPAVDEYNAKIDDLNNASGPLGIEGISDWFQSPGDPPDPDTLLETKKFDSGLTPNEAGGRVMDLTVQTATNQKAAFKLPADYQGPRDSRAPSSLGALMMLKFKRPNPTPPPASPPPATPPPVRPPAPPRVQVTKLTTLTQPPPVTQPPVPPVRPPGSVGSPTVPPVSAPPPPARPPGAPGAPGAPGRPTAPARPSAPTAPSAPASRGANATAPGKPGVPSAPGAKPPAGKPPAGKMAPPPSSLGARGKGGKVDGAPGRAIPPGPKGLGGKPGAKPGAAPPPSSTARKGVQGPGAQGSRNATTPGRPASGGPPGRGTGTPPMKPTAGKPAGTGSKPAGKPMTGGKPAAARPSAAPGGSGKFSPTPHLGNPKGGNRSGKPDKPAGNSKQPDLLAKRPGRVTKPGGATPVLTGRSGTPQKPRATGLPASLTARNKIPDTGAGNKGVIKPVEPKKSTVPRRPFVRDEARVAQLMADPETAELINRMRRLVKLPTPTIKTPEAAKPQTAGPVVGYKRAPSV